MITRSLVDELIYNEARNEVVHAYASHEKARRIFGDASSVSLEDGIERMAEWARRVGSRRSPVFQGIEVERQLPKSWRLD